jgi:hypothetical protein
MSNIFSLPHKCPVSTKVGCTVSSDQDISPDTNNNRLQLQEQVLTALESLDRISTPDVNISKSGLKFAASTSSMHMKIKRAKAPLVVTEVRRSERLKGKSDGYKARACDNRSCFCCSTDPPTLSLKVIRSLGTDFCKMSSKMVSDEALKSKMVGKKKAVCKVSKPSKADKSKKVENEDKSKKKCRKN